MADTAGEAIKTASEAIKNSADAVKTVTEGGPRSGKRARVGPLQTVGRLLLGLAALLATTASLSGFIDGRAAHAVSCATTYLRVVAGTTMAALIVGSFLLICWLAKKHPAYLSSLTDLSPEAQQSVLQPTVTGTAVTPPHPKAPTPPPAATPSPTTTPPTPTSPPPSAAE